MFAEASNQFMGALVYALIALSGVVFGVFGIYFGFRKKRVHVMPQPLEVRKAARRYNHEVNERQHSEHERRLNQHDAEINQLWRTVNTGMPEMERRLNESGEERSGKIHDRINELVKAVGELTGRIK